MKPIVYIAVATLLVLAAAGYWLLPQMTAKPEVAVKGVDYRVEDKVAVFGVEIPTNMTVVVRTEVYNPNILALKVTGAECKVYINDAEIGDGRLTGPLEVPPKGIRDMTVEVNLPTEKGLSGILSAVSEGAAVARVKGKVRVLLPVLGEAEVPLDESYDLSNAVR